MPIILLLTFVIRTAISVTYFRSLTQIQLRQRPVVYQRPKLEIS